MKVKQRARSTAAKLERKVAILAAAENLLRHSGYDAMTMQAVATEVGLAKGTLYLYFPSREVLILEIYGRLFEQWIDKFAFQASAVTGVEEFCQNFYRHTFSELPTHGLAAFAVSLMESQIDRRTYIKSKRATASRVKKLAGIAYQSLGTDPILAQKLIWGLLTVAAGAIQGQ